MRERSSDVVDQAAEAEERFTMEALEFHKANKKESKLEPIGACYTCGEEFEDIDSPKLFCNGVCARNHP